MKIDYHAHIFNANESAINNPRYKVNYNATVVQYITHLKKNNFSNGVLVQPSFLGTNNERLLSAIAEYPDLLKGVVVLDVNSTSSEMFNLKSKGIIGARLNLFGQELPNLKTDNWQQFLNNLEKSGLHLELHCPMPQLLILLPIIKQYNIPIVIDHFGRVDNQSMQLYDNFISLITSDKIWIKVSAYYRLDKNESAALSIAKRCFKGLIDHGLSKSLVWGSDWPHTQYETNMTYQKSLQAFKAITDDQQIEFDILNQDYLYK